MASKPVNAEQPVRLIQYQAASSSNPSGKSGPPKSGSKDKSPVGNGNINDSFLSDNHYDDNYVSIDSQLGKFDVNFKRNVKKEGKRNSDDNIAMQFNNSLDQGKDLNETDPKVPEPNNSSLERDENSMSFQSVPMESLSSKAKHVPINVLKAAGQHKTTTESSS